MDTQQYLYLAWILCAAALAYAWLWRRPSGTGEGAGSAQDYERTERALMPQEIAKAKLVFSEKTFYRRGDRPFAAKCDQAFLTRDGFVVPVESKTRARMTASDLVQISSAAVAMAADPRVKHKVANWGYIRLAPAGGAPYYQRVDLMHVTRIDQLWDRWHALKNRRVAPLYRPDPSRCRTCVLRAKCPSAQLPKRR